MKMKKTMCKVAQGKMSLIAILVKLNHSMTSKPSKMKRKMWMKWTSKKKNRRRKKPS